MSKKQTNNPNANFAAYEQDREAKRKAQTGWTPQDSEREMLRLNNELIKTEAQRDELQAKLAKREKQYADKCIRLMEVEAQRDELLAAGKAAVAKMEAAGIGFGETELLAAIAKAGVAQ